MTKSDAQQLVRVVQLTTTDLPGYDEAPPDKSGTDPLTNTGFSRCAGTVPNSKELADLSSNTFSRTLDNRFEQIGSEAGVYKSAALVRKDLKASRTKRARTCLLNQIRRESGSDPTVELVSASVSALKPGVKNGLALRVKTVLRTQGQTVPVYTDALIFGAGQVEAGIVAISGPVPAPRTEEDDLLKIVRSRVNGQLASGGIF